jgi:hypothetical protein
VLQFALLEYFGANGNPIGQFIGTVDATNPNALTGIKQTWMDPVSRHLLVRNAIFACITMLKMDSQER